MNIVTMIEGTTAACIFGAALAVGAPSAHAAPPLQSVAAKDCDLGFMPTKPTIGVGSIIGNAWARCDTPPQSHEMHLALQVRQGGQWQAARMISDSRIPAPRIVYEVTTSCKPGIWRVQAEVVGSLNGTPFHFVDSSMERFVTADDCARGN